MRQQRAGFSRCLASRRALVIGVTTSLWAVAVGMGCLFLFRYAMTPGRTSGAVDTWPQGASFRPDGTRSALVMFLHPHCPCSGASIEGLSRLLVRHQNHLQTFVVFVRPEGVAPDWEKTNLWSAVAALPGVTLVSDERGRDRGCFGAAISGETLLYGASGRLLFHGGITPARGHAGDSAGHDALAALIDSPSGPLVIFPVFGCPLTTDD